MNMIETERLILKELSTDDAPFIFKLVNDPSWIRFIGDRNVKNLEDAKKYIINGPLKSYRDNGFGLYLVELKESRESIGICGLIKRDSLDDPDVGFALFPEFTGNGYAIEAAKASIEYGRNVLGMNKIVAITTKDNYSSIKLLETLGFRFDKFIKLPGDEAKLKYFVLIKTD